MAEYDYSIEKVSELQDLAAAIRTTFNLPADTTLTVEQMAEYLNDVLVSYDDALLVNLLQRSSAPFGLLPGVTGIGDYAFYNYTNLPDETLVIPYGAKSIGDYAFYGCSNIKTVILPPGISIGNYTFHSCPGLTNVYVCDRTTDYNNTEISIGINAFDDYQNLTIHVPYSNFNSYDWDPDGYGYIKFTSNNVDLVVNSKEEYDELAVGKGWNT